MQRPRRHLPQAPVPLPQAARAILRPWNLRLTTEKNGVDFACRVDSYLTPYIDALVLQGLDAAFLDAARTKCLEKRRPVLVTRAGEGVGDNFVSDIWRKYFSIGEHITRTEMHESFAAARGAEGAELALAAFAQQSPQTAGHYDGVRIHSDRLTKMQTGLVALAGDMPVSAFEV